MSENSKLIFVYGTLKKGFHLHHYLDGVKFIDATMTRENAYDLEAIGGEDVSPFPAMIPGKFHITGELYDVPDKILKVLDKLEWRYQRTELMLKDVVPPAFFYRYDQKKVTNTLPNNPMVWLDSLGKTKTWIIP